MEQYLGKLYFGVGLVPYRLRLPLPRVLPDSKSNAPSPPVILLLWWPYRFLHVQFPGAATSREQSRAGDSQRSAEAASGIKEVTELLLRNGINKTLPNNYEFAACRTIWTENVEIDITINTNDPAFREFSTRAPVTERPVMGLSWSVIYKDQEGDIKHEQGRVSLTFEPIPYPPPFRGVVGVDLGNTNSTVVYLDVTDTPRTYNIKCLPHYDYNRVPPPQQRSEFRPVQSIVRFDAVTDKSCCQSDELEASVDIMELPEAYDYRVGTFVNKDKEPPHGLVANPKRSVVAKSEFVHKVTTRRASFPAKRDFKIQPDWVVIDLPASRPAELFLCRLFEGLRSVCRAWPTKIAVTYPTSYSANELSLVRKCVFRAWKKAERNNPWVGKHNEDSLIPMMIDEASAAAIYYLAQHVVEGPGGLASFRWLYPRGFHLLVYDCGGATTDIAVVRAEAPTRDVLRLVVLGRTGLRDFAGDDITSAIFVLLKAKVAAKVAENQGHSLGLPALPKDIKHSNSEYWRYYTDECNYRKLDEYVPTDFDDTMSAQERELRQQLTWLFWEWAEEEKKRLSELPGESGVPATLGHICKELSEFHGGIVISEEDLNSTRVHRNEVDLLVYGPVQRSVERAAGLVADKCPYAEMAVDDIFLVGFGSAYPLIGELLRKRFLGSDNGERDRQLSLYGIETRFSFEDAKTCVAKGAAIGLALRHATLGVELQIDSDLSSRLPFHIGWHDAASNTCVSLWEEGQRYQELEECTINVSQQDGKKVHWIRLQHRWPGAEYEPFLVFDFPDGVEGEVSIRFDPNREQFLARSHATSVEVEAKRDIDPRVYRSAPQRGCIRVPKET